MAMVLLIINFVLIIFYSMAAGFAAKFVIDYYKNKKEEKTLELMHRSCSNCELAGKECKSPFPLCGVDPKYIKWIRRREIKLM